MYLPENIPELDKCHSGTCFRAAGCESALMHQHYVLNAMSSKENTQKTRLCIYLLGKLMTRGWQEPNPVLLLGAMILYSLRSAETL